MDVPIHLAQKPGDENPFAESDLSDIFDGDGFSKRLWSPGETSHRFLCSHFDWLKNPKILQNLWLQTPESKVQLAVQYLSKCS